MGQINIGVSVAQSGLQDIDKLAAGLQKTGKISDQTAASFKTSSKSISDFLQQVKATQTPLQQMLQMFQAGGSEFAKYKSGLKAAALEMKGLSASFTQLATSGASWRAALDGIYSSQLRGIVNSKAQIVANEQLNASFNKLIAVRAQTISLQNGQAAAMAKLLAVEEAELAVAAGKVAQSTFLTQVTARLTISTAGLTAVQIAGLHAQEANQAVALGLASAYNAQAGAVTRASGAFTVFGSVVRGVAGSLGMLWFAYGQLLPLMAAFAAASSIKIGITEAVDFEYITQNIYSINDASERSKISLEGLRKQLMHLKEANGAFAELRHTPLELAEGMQELARSGVGMVESLRDLPELSRMASLGQMELSEAVKSTIGGVNAFRNAQADSYYEMKQGITVMDETIKATLSFGDVANMMAKAADISSTEIQELAKALTHATEAGVVSGMRFDETMAALAGMANAGIRGSNSATAFRTALMKLATPTDKVKELLDGLNLSFSMFRKDGSTKNLIENLTDLHDVLSRLTDEKRVELVREMFTLRSGKAMVLAVDPAKIAEMAKQIRMAAGDVSYLQTRFDELSRTAKVAGDLLRVEFKAILTEAFTSDAWSNMLYGMLDALKALRPAIVGTFEVLGDFFEGVKYGSVAILPYLAVGLWDAGKAMFALVPAASAAATSVASLSTAFLTLKGSLMVLASFAAGWALGTWLREEFAEVDLMGIALVAGFQKIFAAVKEFGSGIIDHIKLTFDGLVKLFKVSIGSLVVEVGTLLEKLWNWMADSVEKNSRILKFIGVDAAGMAANFRAAASGTAGAMKDFGNSLSGGKSIAEAFDDVVTSLVDNVRDHYAAYDQQSKAIDDVAISLAQESLATHEAKKAADAKAAANRGLSQSYADLGAQMEAMAKARAEGKTLGVGGLSDDEKSFLNRLLPSRKALEDYEAGVTEIRALQEKLKGTTQELSDTDVSTMMRNLAAQTIDAGKAAKGSAESLEDFKNKVDEAFGVAAQGKLSDYEKTQQKIKKAYNAMTEAAKGTPNQAASVGLIAEAMERANAAAEQLQQDSFGPFKKGVEEAFGDAQTKKLSAYAQELERINKIAKEQYAKAQTESGGHPIIFDLKNKVVADTVDSARRLADIAADKDLQKFLEGTDDVFGKQSQRNMDEAQKEMLKLNAEYDKRLELINDTYPAEETLTKTVEARKAAIADLNTQYWLAVQNSEILIKKNGTLWDGFALGARDAAKSVKTLGEVGYEVAGELNKAFHDTFVAVLKGDFDSIGDLWESLLDRMLDMFIDWIASLIARWVMGGIAEMFMGSGSGLLGSFGGLLAEVMGGGSSSGGGSGGLGSFGSMGSLLGAAYEYFTGTSLTGTAASWLGMGQATVAPYVPGAGQYLGMSAVTPASAAAPASTAAPASAAAPASEFSMGAAMPYVAAATWVAAAAWAFSSWQSSKMEPTKADMFNQIGLRPDDFANLIGEGFKKASIPLFGEVLAKWDETSNSLLMLPEVAEYNSKRSALGASDQGRVFQQMIWDEDAPTWRGGGSLFDAIFDETFFDSLEMLGQWSKKGVPQTLEEYADALGSLGIVMDPSTVASLWEWGNTTMTSMEKIQMSFGELGLSGSALVRATELLEKAYDDANGSTEELENYLLDLGYSAEEVSSLLSEFTGNYIEQMRSLGEDAMSPAMQAMAEQVKSYESLTATMDLSSVKSRELSNDLRTASGGVDSLGNSLASVNYGVDNLNSSVSDLAYGLGDAVDYINGLVVAPGTMIETTTGVVAEGSARGGLLRGGSGVRDDLYIGTIQGRPQMAMGGEYVVNPRSTKKHLSILDAINADTYLLGGRMPAPSTEWSKDARFPSTTRSSRTSSDAQELEELMDGIFESLRLFDATDLEKALYETDQKFKDIAEEAKRLGASEDDLLKIEGLRVATNTEIMEEYKKAQADYMQDINDQISAFSMSDMEIAIRDTVRAMEESIAKAKELGLSEAELSKIRELQQLQANEILEQQKKAQSDFMLGITDQIAMMGMTQTEQSLYQLNRELENTLLQAEELGLGEAELAKIRELYGLKAAEVMNQGLTEAMNSMASFKDAMGGIENASMKSANAQQRLFDILTQAKAGDFTGVETIGEVLKDISIDKSKYATAADYARDYWRTMGAVSQIEVLTGNKIAGVTTEVPTISSTTEASIRNQEALNTKVDDLRASVVAGNVQTIKFVQKTAKMLERWEATGMPVTRVA